MFGSWRRLHPVSHDEDGNHDHDLPHEHEPPRGVRRHPATDHRADRDRGAGDAADDPVGERTVLPLVVRRDQSGDGRDHQHCAEAFDERPAEEQDAEVRAQRRRQRAKPVDREADGEGAVATPDVAELRPHEHERRHHQRVRGDRGLHARHRRVEVGHDLRDRDVHHARVEHHHELRRSKDDQGEPAHRPDASGRPVAARLDGSAVGIVCAVAPAAAAARSTALGRAC